MRVLSAAKRQLISGNPALEQPPPRAPTRKVKVPTEDQIAPMLDSLVGTEFHVPVVLTINTALRRSELLALRWSDINLDAATLTVARALDETRAGGVTFKSTKTESGLRTISLPAAAVVALRQHRKAQLERCLLLGLGRPASDSLLFGPESPSRVQPTLAAHRQAAEPATLHVARLAASQLLAAAAPGVDIGTVSKRLGHSRIDTTARVYAHAIAKDDRHAADALDKALGQ